MLEIDLTKTNLFELSQKIQKEKRSLKDDFLTALKIFNTQLSKSTNNKIKLQFIDCGDVNYCRLQNIDSGVEKDFVIVLFSFNREFFDCAKLSVTFENSSLHRAVFKASNNIWNKITIKDFFNLLGTDINIINVFLDLLETSTKKVSN